MSCGIMVAPRRLVTAADVEKDIRDIRAKVFGIKWDAPFAEDILANLTKYFMAHGGQPCPGSIAPVLTVIEGNKPLKQIIAENTSGNETALSYSKMYGLPAPAKPSDDPISRIIRGSSHDASSAGSQSKDLQSIVSSRPGSRASHRLAAVDLRNIAHDAPKQIEG